MSYRQPKRIRPPAPKSEKAGAYLAKRASLAERFWRYAERGEPDACWPWRGGKNNCGYGVLSVVYGKMALAHRVSFEIHNGPIPKGAIILHRCDSPSCVNPAHLAAGSARDNVLDAIAKGRHRGDTNLRQHRFMKSSSPHPGDRRMTSTNAPSGSR